jgi:hypothetical protein
VASVGAALGDAVVELTEPEEQAAKRVIQASKPRLVPTQRKRVVISFLNVILSMCCQCDLKSERSILMIILGIRWKGRFAILNFEDAHPPDSSYAPNLRT